MPPHPLLLALSAFGEMRMLRRPSDGHLVRVRPGEQPHRHHQLHSLGNAFHPCLVRQLLAGMGGDRRVHMLVQPFVAVAAEADALLIRKPIVDP